MENVFAIRERINFSDVTEPSPPEARVEFLLGWS